MEVVTPFARVHSIQKSATQILNQKSFHLHWNRLCLRSHGTSLQSQNNQVCLAPSSHAPFLKSSNPVFLRNPDRLSALILHLAQSQRKALNLLNSFNMLNSLRFGSWICIGSLLNFDLSVWCALKPAAKLFSAFISWPVVPWNPWNFCPLESLEPLLPFEPLERLLPLLSLTQCFPWLGLHEPESLEHKWPLGSQAPVCKSLMLGIARAGKNQAKLFADLGLQQISLTNWFTKP